MIIPHFSTYQWLLAVAAALCIGMSKSGLSGLGMLTVLLMAEVMPARESTGVVLPLLISGDILAVLIFQKHAQWKHVWRILPPACVGIVAGYFLMQIMPGQIFRPVIGWVVLILSGLQLWRKRNPGVFQQLPHTRRFAWLMGGASGVTTMMANAAGPVMTLYLLALDLPKLEFVGTGAWAFLVINLIKVPFSAHLGLINGPSLLLNLTLVPAVVVGIWIGSRLVHCIPQKLFEFLVLLSAAIASLRFIIF